MFIDTHAHLYLDKFNEDIDTVLENALKQGVTKVLLPNIDSSSTEALIKLVENHPSQCFPMMGLHPCSVKQNFMQELDHVRTYLMSRPFIGVGEIGIDLYWDKTFEQQQIEAFEAQIEMAKEFDLPIVIHSRDSLDLTIEIVRKHQNGNLKGIFHCFNGSIPQMQDIIAMDFYVGFGGVITYKNAKLLPMVQETPMDRMVLETDAPYLSPVPYRGKRNQSAYIPVIAELIASVKNISIEEVANATTSNAIKLFKLETPKDSLFESNN